MRHRGARGEWIPSSLDRSDAQKTSVDLAPGHGLGHRVPELAPSGPGRRGQLRLGSFVAVYDGDGRFLRRIGRKGAGPGEFGSPSDLFFDPEGRLWVRDARRATVFAATERGGIPDSVVQTRPFQGLINWMSTARSRLIHGFYYYPDYRYPHGEPDRYFYSVYGPSGLTADTVPVTAYEGRARAGS